MRSVKIVNGQKSITTYMEMENLREATTVYVVRTTVLL